MKLRELLQQLKVVQEEIGASPPMICGGTPRDKYMGRLDNISDLDVTTGDKTVDYLSQEFAIKLKRKYNITRKTMDDGHSSIFVGNLKIDFSSNFVVQNINHYLEQMKITEPTSMQQEMFSRDFTCNALLLTLDLKQILDPTKRGFQDIKDRVIKTCLAPDITLTSNRNRVIRAVYLACKLGFDIDESIISYVRNVPEIIKISTEKAMAEKLNEAFERDGDKASFLLTRMGLWNYIPITEKAHPYYLKQLKGKVNVKK
jgi:poly(A) polymerase